MPLPRPLSVPMSARCPQMPANYTHKFLYSKMLRARQQQKNTVSLCVSQFNYSLNRSCFMGKHSIREPQLRGRFNAMHSIYCNRLRLIRHARGFLPPLPFVKLNRARQTWGAAEGESERKATVAESISFATGPFRKNATSLKLRSASSTKTENGIKTLRLQQTRNNVNIVVYILVGTL